MSKLKYGPQTYQIEKVIERLKTITMGKAEKLYKAWDVGGGEPRDFAWDATQDAAWDAHRGKAWSAAEEARRDFDWDAAWDAAVYAAWDAIAALVVRDLIGETFTQAHYDLLTKPWRDVIGEFEEPTQT